MDIRQLEAFVYTVKYQSFSLAAQKLYLSQPTVSSHINNAVPPKTDLEVYQTALAEGKITEKERLLWEYVLSAYGAEEFTTKQLEKDFRNAAYATIRTFVMKFHEMGLLTARKAGNRVFYRVGGTSDGRPNESKRRTL